jgi:hypothetical protein
MSIKRWFIGKLKRALRDHNENASLHWNEAVSRPTLASSHDSRLRSAGMNFTVYNADGGYVLEYHTYDNKTDTTENRIHIIQDNEDFGDRLAKILTLELLRR